MGAKLLLTRGFLQIAGNMINFWKMDVKKHKSTFFGPGNTVRHSGNYFSCDMLPNNLRPAARYIL